MDTLSFGKCIHLVGRAGVGAIHHLANYGRTALNESVSAASSFGCDGWFASAHLCPQGIGDTETQKDPLAVAWAWGDLGWDSCVGTVLLFQGHCWSTRECDGLSAVSFDMCVGWGCIIGD